MGQPSHIYTKLRMAKREKVKLKTYFHPPTGRTKKQEYVLALKETFKPYKTKIISIGSVTSSIIFQGFLRALEEGKKLFQNFVGTTFLKKPESIYLPITKM